MMEKFENKEFDFGATFGALLGFVVATLVWTLPLPTKNSWIYDYQTLVAGLFALVAGAVSIISLNAQMRQAEKFKRDELESERRSSQPLLSFTLVEILDYSRNCFEHLRKFEVQVLASGKSSFILPVQIDVPSFPYDTFSSLQLNLKFGSPSAIVVISKLLLKMQIQNSRYHNLVNPDVDLTDDSLLNLHCYMVDALEISTLCSRLFPYARDEVQEIDTHILKEHLVHAGTLAVNFESQDRFMLHILNHYVES